MKPSDYYSIKVLIITALFCLLAGTAYGGQVTGNIFYEVPKIASPLYIGCGSGGRYSSFQPIPPMQGFTWIFDDSVAGKCKITCGPYKFAFSVYDPQRDGGHSTVFWRVKTEGFYHSLDNMHWRLMFKWH